MKEIFKNTFMLLFLILFIARLSAQDVRVSLFYNQLTEGMTFHCISGEYSVMSDGLELFRIGEGDILLLDRKNGQIRLSTQEGTKGEFPEISFRDLLLKGRFMLKSVKPASQQNLYRGNLFLTLKHDAIEVINEFEFSHYISGVVEAEAGPGAPLEFYKAQAVICRTYAVKNWYRHADEGFNLCDDTHCQVFHGIVDENPSIHNAVLSTHNIVIADKNYNLINAAYHSNSGGETQRAGDIWPGEYDYLLPIIDPYSVDQPAYLWEDSFPVSVWRSYLDNRGIDTTGLPNDEIMIQQEHRKMNFIINEDTLSIKEIREDFGLRSAFFNMELLENEIILKGKGYGHGVGLSQEGAIQMAEQGFSYQDILQFYYFDIQVRNLNELPLSAFPSVFR